MAAIVTDRLGAQARTLGISVDRGFLPRETAIIEKCRVVLTRATSGRNSCITWNRSDPGALRARHVAALNLVWHPRVDGDAGHRFLREVFLRAPKEAAADRHEAPRTRLDATDPASSRSRKRQRRRRGRAPK